MIGPALPPSAALSAARGAVYLDRANLTEPLAILAACAAAGAVLTLAATAWGRHPPRLVHSSARCGPQAPPPQPAWPHDPSAPRSGRPAPDAYGDAARHAGLAGRARYQIRVRGRLCETICSAFPGLRARTEGGDTVLTGVLADQAALYGVLAEAEALGLELLEVRRLPPRDEPQAPSS